MAAQKKSSKPSAADAQLAALAGFSEGKSLFAPAFDRPSTAVDFGFHSVPSVPAIAGLSAMPLSNDLADDITGVEESLPYLFEDDAAGLEALETFEPHTLREPMETFSDVDSTQLPEWELDTDDRWLNNVDDPDDATETSPLNSLETLAPLEPWEAPTAAESLGELPHLTDLPDLPGLSEETFTTEMPGVLMDRIPERIPEALPDLNEDFFENTLEGFPGLLAGTEDFAEDFSAFWEDEVPDFAGERPTEAMAAEQALAVSVSETPPLPPPVETPLETPYTPSDAVAVPKLAPVSQNQTNLPAAHFQDTQEEDGEDWLDLDLGLDMDVDMGMDMDIDLGLMEWEGLLPSDTEPEPMPTLETLPEPEIPHRDAVAPVNIQSSLEHLQILPVTDAAMPGLTDTDTDTDTDINDMDLGLSEWESLLPEDDQVDWEAPGLDLLAPSDIDPLLTEEDQLVAPGFTEEEEIPPTANFEPTYQEKILADAIPEKGLEFEEELFPDPIHLSPEETAVIEPFASFAPAETPMVEETEDEDDLAEAFEAWLENSDDLLEEGDLEMPSDSEPSPVVGLAAYVAPETPLHEASNQGMAEGSDPLEGLEILYTFPVSSSQTLFLVHMEQVYALMGQVLDPLQGSVYSLPDPEQTHLQEQIAVLKIFSHHPLADLPKGINPETALSVSQEGQVGNKTMYRVCIGLWKGIISVTPDAMELLMELNA